MVGRLQLWYSGWGSFNGEKLVVVEMAVANVSARQKINYCIIGGRA